MSFSLRIQSADARAAEAAAAHQAQISAAVERHVEAQAQALGYASATALTGYLGSTVAPWAAEARAFVTWRDAVWTKVFAVSGQEQVLTPDAVIAALPAWGG